MQNKEMSYSFHGLCGKKASISVGVMVIVTVLLFTYILISLNNSSTKISENFGIVSQLNDVYSEQQGYENTLHFRLVEVFLNSYQEVLNQNSLEIGPEQKDFNVIFNAKIYSNFVVQDKSIDPVLNNLFLSSHSFFDGETATISITPWRIERNLTFNEVNGSRIIYSSNLNSSVSFKMLELPSFDYIKKSYSECVKLEEKELISSCFTGAFSGFEIGFSKLDPGIVELISKDSYYINKKMDNIKFSLKFNYADKIEP